MKTFVLPDLGEGLAEAEIVEWHVSVGDVVKMDQPLVSVETAKAVVEVPSPYTGKVVKLYGGVGDLIETGKPLVDFEVEGGLDQGTVVGKVEVGNEMVRTQASNFTNQTSSALGVKATPAVRALANKLGVDLTKVAPTGPNNTVTMQDVTSVGESKEQKGHSRAASFPTEPLKGVRRLMAQAMQRSHAEVVPVTVFDDADITEWAATGDITVRVILAIAKACQKEPSLNAWYDGEAVGRKVFQEIHLGMAVDTEDGLFVPVMRNVQEKQATVLRQELNEIKQKIQNRTITPQEMQGATITLSNFGKFSGRYANPIIVLPMVSILAIGRIREECLFINDVPSKRVILPLSLTFDHRAVTGGEATRFLGLLIEALK